MDETDLGLSFQKDDILDMRMDESLGVTAADLVNSLSEKELTKMIRDLSGEMFAKKIAKKIVSVRSLKRLERTKELVDLVSSTISPGYEKGRIHPATRTFQALRIAVNDELSNLETSLPRAERLLLPGGRMMVISFHSLEDKIVKNFGQGAQPTLKVINKKPIVPTQKEISENIRARSAKMRVFEKEQ
jgi:16S rRNA (cytosine1402-N4)-methyltransferase